MFFTFYRVPGLSEHQSNALESYLTIKAKARLSLTTETCFYIETTSNEELTEEQYKTLLWLLSETFEPKQTRKNYSYLPAPSSSSPGNNYMVEIGPRMNFSTAWSSNAVTICQACNLHMIERIERATRYYITGPAYADFKEVEIALLDREMDRMTQQVYTKPLTSFRPVGPLEPAPVRTIPVLEEGIEALEKLNQEIGLGFDAWDVQYYFDLFTNKLKRNPTDVECFDMGQSNSEHSRHWFFGGKMILDGREKPHTLFQLVKSTLTASAKENSLIAFHDNSSVIRGTEKCPVLGPQSPGAPGAYVKKEVDLHPLLTAETHNFPSGVAPFPGAETGTGGRIRDVQATGRGAHVLAGVSAYCVGNLHLEGYNLPWEKEQEYPSNLAHPREILIQASNGASDYGNKFGEPVVTGFARSFGMQTDTGRREYLKPIMFSAGIGQLDGTHTKKGQPEIEMLVVKVGGPCYRIGMGGGAASSRITDAINAERDFNAVQRGDAEMESKMNKVIRACVDLGPLNPIVTIHDQGAGGNGNVLKEIVERTDGKAGGGATYDVRKILLGDATLSVLEIWGAEYQENNALLLKPEDLPLFSGICERENCPFAVLGHVTGTGQVILCDSNDGSTPFNLHLDLVLGKMPQKTFVDTTEVGHSHPLDLGDEDKLTVRSALEGVLRLVSVGSKRFLVNKVDRSVSGLIAQQQTVGPLQLPLADVAVVAQTHSSIVDANGAQRTPGIATACGEQPIKGLLNAAAMARLTVGESLTNLVWANLSGRGLEDAKCSANWMWAAKLPGEASRMYDCCVAMTEFMKQVGCAVDGGKDSLSMAAKVGSEQVKAPGTLVITMYAAVHDVSKTVTPDLKPQASDLYLVDLSGSGKTRLGGSSLANVFAQLGDDCPDVEDAKLFKRAFEATQKCISNSLLLAGHDRSDGGLIVTLLEMAFGGNIGITVDIPTTSANMSMMDQIAVLFNEELGLVFQVATGSDATDVTAIFAEANVPLTKIGSVNPATDDPTSATVKVSLNGASPLLDESLVDLRDIWEATSFELEKLQTNPACVQMEQTGLRSRITPQWQLKFTPTITPEYPLSSQTPRVVVLREEGSNGEREMLAAFHAAGLEPWDVTMSDLVKGRIQLDNRFSGIVFVGGFSFGDVLGSGKGWAGVVKYHSQVLTQFSTFTSREDTFSLGVCNGCQLMALLGLVTLDANEEQLPRFIHNASGRYESRFVSVKIEESTNSVLLKGMGGSSFGVWVAHGEGRAHFPSAEVMQQYEDKNLIPLRYVDDNNVPTEVYPFNPNGSPRGIAGLTSVDGRHLCLMPHPERCFLQWQWPWMPKEFEGLNASPWLQLFQNARKFCDSVSTF